jgi:hypothetical protein
LPPSPKGVEVQARGPVHEAFATPTSEPAATKPVPKKPPEPIKEMPPEQKPEGDVIWIGGYWAYDDERQDFLWVSGIWRATPPGKQWVAGYWREASDKWQWVPGFWSEAAQDKKQELTYLPAPPPPPETASPGSPPSEDSFYVPGVYVWDRSGYAWRAGYWGRVQPGYVWVAAHYSWTPGGYVFIPGYWDFAVARRGVLYAPVVVDYGVVGVGFVYTPAYVVSDTIIVDSLFIRPCCCHYYFGDYYGPVYRSYGFESCVVYGRGHYDAIFVYSSWEHRADPGWATFQLDLCLARHAGRAPCPPRTLVQQNITVQNNINVTNNYYARNTGPVLMTPGQLASARGVSNVPLSTAQRSTALQQASFTQQVAAQRSLTEVSTPGQRLSQPRSASFNLSTPPPGMTPSRSAGLGSGIGASQGIPSRPSRAPIATSTSPSSSGSTLSSAPGSHLQPYGPGQSPSAMTPHGPYGPYGPNGPGPRSLLNRPGGPPWPTNRTHPPPQKPQQQQDHHQGPPQGGPP